MDASMMADKPYRRNRSPAMAALVKHVEDHLTPQKGRGGIAWIARKLGLTKQGVSRWTSAPIERVPKISEVTGLPMNKIRPDLPEIFPPLDSNRRRKSKASA